VKNISLCKTLRNIVKHFLCIANVGIESKQRSIFGRNTKKMYDYVKT